MSSFASPIVKMNLRDTPSKYEPQSIFLSRHRSNRNSNLLMIYMTWKTFPKIVPNDNFIVMVLPWKKTLNKSNSSTCVTGWLQLPYHPPPPVPHLYMNVLTTPFENINEGKWTQLASTLLTKSQHLNWNSPSSDFLPSNSLSVVLSGKWISSWWLSHPLEKYARQIGWFPQGSR